MRDLETFKVIPHAFRTQEFSLPKIWTITEKIDGTNVRIGYNEGSVTIGGRTDKANMPSHLMDMLLDTFTVEKMRGVFYTVSRGDIPNVVLFGEGYGPKIQAGGGDYTDVPSFRLFDIWIDGWWLEWDKVKDLAQELGVKCVPDVGYVMKLPETLKDLDWLLPESIVAKEDGGMPGKLAEGIVARTEPLLLMRNQDRLIWKLKRKDF